MHFVLFYKLPLQHYGNHKDNPPLARDMPPVAGRIGWARHLFKKIEEPMLHIKVRLDFCQQTF